MCKQCPSTLPHLKKETSQLARSTNIRVLACAQFLKCCSKRCATKILSRLSSSTNTMYFKVPWAVREK